MVLQHNDLMIYKVSVLNKMGKRVCPGSKPGQCQYKCCINVNSLAFHAEICTGFIRDWLKRYVHLKILSRKDVFHRRKSCWFGTTSGWVNDNSISDFRRTIPLSVWRSSVILADNVEKQRLPRVALKHLFFLYWYKGKIPISFLF